MLKNTLLLYILIFIFPNMIAQNLILYDLDGNVISNETVYYEGNTNDNLIEMGLKVTNNGQTAINVKVKKEEVSITDGTENYFCWKECYAPNIFVSPDFLTIESGATNDRSFKGDYKPNQKDGESSIRYTFFNMDDEQDMVTVLVVYNVSSPTSVSQLGNKSQVSKPYPVPANEFVTIEYKLDRTDGVKLEIFNLQGLKTEERLIKQAKGEFILFSDKYKSGIYLYQFTQNGKVIDSGKFIFQ